MNCTLIYKCYSGSDPTQLDPIAVTSVLVSVSVLAASYHAQDFKDVEGDRLLHRQTIPIVFPKIAKFTVIFPVMTASAMLSILWQLDLIASTIFMLLAFTVGSQYLVGTTVKQYQVGFYWYNVRHHVSRCQYIRADSQIFKGLVVYSSRPSRLL
jgi:4-hydroxybenzoate polyprenyltransferase